MKIRTTPANIDTFLRVFKSHSEIIFPQHILHVVRDDPSDDRILECAVEGKANMIVSGDHHLLTLKSFRGIRIMTVREFLDSVHNT